MPPPTSKTAGPPSPFTPKEFLDEVNLLTIEIEAAIVIHHTFEEINHLGLYDKKVLNALQRDALFWRTQLACLQTSLFLTLSRIFDTDPNAHTIHTLLNATLGNIHLFSASALEARRKESGTKPEWLDSFIAQAWTPSSAKDLRHLKTLLTPHARRFEQVYRPIRHAVYAHRLMTDLKAGATLFIQTDRSEITEMLDFLHDLIMAIRNLFENGLNPELGKRDFKEHNRDIRDGVESLLKRL